MFGFRLAWVFRSRWVAVLWCALIVWMAVDLVGTPEEAGNGAGANATDVTGAPVTERDIAVLRNFAEGR